MCHAVRGHRVTSAEYPTGTLMRKKTGPDGSLGKGAL